MSSGAGGRHGGEIVEQVMWVPATTVNPIGGGTMWSWETPVWPAEARRRFDEDDADEMEGYDFDEEELDEDYEEEEDEDYDEYEDEEEEDEDYEDYDELEDEFDEEDEGPRPPRRRRDWE
jgi:hypothetical protein